MGRIRFEPVSRFTDDQLRAHRDYSRGLGLPEIGSAGAVAPRLAVLGGSPEIAGQVDRLRAWDGEIWAINGTHQWCREHGISATLYRIDPLAPNHSLEGVERAVLADIVHPSAFDALLSSGTRVELARLGSGPGEHAIQTTAAGTAPFLALARGHRHVSYFGCESSHGPQTHAYKAERPNLVWVECGGEEYLTSPQMVMQVEWLAEAARAFPQFISIECGGLLKALVEHGDYNVTHVCRALNEVLVA